MWRTHLHYWTQRTENTKSVCVLNPSQAHFWLALSRRSTAVSVCTYSHDYSTAHLWGGCDRVVSFNLSVLNKDCFCFFLFFGGYKSFLWGHWYSCFGLLVTSPLGFKARVGILILAWQRHTRFFKRLNHRRDSIQGTDYIANYLVLNLRVSRTTIENLKWWVGGDIIPLTFGKFVTLLVQKLKILGRKTDL